MTKYLMIGAFGLIGVFARYGIGANLNRALGESFPVGTFLINLVGCFLIGIVYVLGTEKNILNTDLRVALTVGLLGGFTTFSAYGLETSLLLKNQNYMLAFFYLSASALLGVLATFVGFFTAHTILNP